MLSDKVKEPREMAFPTAPGSKRNHGRSEVAASDQWEIQYHQQAHFHSLFIFVPFDKVKTWCTNEIIQTKVTDSCSFLSICQKTPLLIVLECHDMIIQLGTAIVRNRSLTVLDPLTSAVVVWGNGGASEDDKMISSHVLVWVLVLVPV
jgi:hypothetical protein